MSNINKTQIQTQSSQSGDSQDTDFHLDFLEKIGQSLEEAPLTSNQISQIKHQQIKNKLRETWGFQIIKTSKAMKQNKTLDVKNEKSIVIRKVRKLNKMLSEKVRKYKQNNDLYANSFEGYNKQV